MPVIIKSFVFSALSLSFFLKKANPCREGSSAGIRLSIISLSYDGNMSEGNSERTTEDERVAVSFYLLFLGESQIFTN